MTSQIDVNTRLGLTDAYTLESLGLALFKGKQQTINIFSVTR